MKDRLDDILDGFYPFCWGRWGKIFFFKFCQKIQKKIVLDSCLLGEYEYVY
jgi:hypothetical protein